MPYDELLADRLRTLLNSKKTSPKEIKMMGGLCFMIDNKMLAGIVRNKLMVRIDPEFYEQALKINGCRKMDFTGKPMKGLVYVEPHAIYLETDLEFWINKALEYNPRAKSSKKTSR